MAGLQICCSRRLQRLAEVLQLIESTGQWPSQTHDWRLCFLPKHRGVAASTPALKTRPIAVGPILYRAWAKLRFKQASKQLGPALNELQVGGLGGHNAHTLLLNFQDKMERENFPLAASWDYSKAFDSIDWELAVPLLTKAGIPNIQFFMSFFP